VIPGLTPMTQRVVKMPKPGLSRLQSESVFRSLVEAVRDYAIFVLDPKGNIMTWNPGAQSIKGYSAEEIIGKHFSIFYPPEDLANNKPGRELEVAAQTGRLEDEGWRLRKDGSPFWASVVITRILDDKGKIIGFGKITRDLTERRRYSQELELRIAERERTNAELEAFSYSVSHDLRAPLRAIEGFSQALREEYSHLFDATANDYLQQVIDASTRMNRLVQDLLNYSRLSRTELMLDRVDLDSALASAIKELTPEERKFILMNHRQKKPVMAHEQTLIQIFANLIANGLKFHAPEQQPQVTIDVRPGARPKTVRVLITDRGIGIAPEHQQRVFQVFERLHGIEDFPGTGIGLAIVKRGMERMDGTYGLESTPGKGSTFWIELQAAEETK
jgi:PAS domain S-box-containing protein